jgi:S1-C subfamily serine protease
MLYAQGDITHDDGIGFFVEGGEKQQRLTRPKLSERERPFLGLSVSPLEETDGNASSGILVSRVVRGSSADVAGIRAGDILLTINGTSITYSEDLVEMIQLYEPGQVIAVDVMRKEERLSLDVRLGSRPQQQEKKWALIWDDNRPYIGIDSNTLNGQLADYFGVQHGVLITAVHRSSPAEDAGLRAGDVLVNWNTKEVNSKRELASLSGAAKSGDSIALEVMRKGEMVNVEIVLGSRKGFFFNDEAQTQMYANRDYIVLPEAMPEGQSELLQAVGEKQEAAALRAEIHRLQKEIQVLRETLAKMNSNIDIKK